MPKFELLEPGTIGLIIQEENGRIVQLAMTEEQSKMLQILVGKISEFSPLIKMGEEHDMVLKSSLYKTLESFAKDCSENEMLYSHYDGDYKDLKEWIKKNV